jgi:hypothetical protein
VTITSIRTKLSDLDTYILTIGSDITQFNGYVRLLIDSLAARGHTTQDLLTNLFKGYQAASDKIFVDFIGQKLEIYEEGKDISADKLIMHLGDNKFKLLTKGRQWNTPSQEEEKILALQAEIKNLKKTSKKKEPHKSYKEKVADKTKERSKYKDKEKVEKPAWFFKEPSADKMKKPKIWKDKLWYYCSPKTGGKCDRQYHRHRPSECEGKAHIFNGDKKQNFLNLKWNRMKIANCGWQRHMKLCKWLITVKTVNDMSNNAM